MIETPLGLLEVRTNPVADAPSDAAAKLGAASASKAARASSAASSDPGGSGSEAAVGQATAKASRTKRTASAAASKARRDPDSDAGSSAGSDADSAADPGGAPATVAKRAAVSAGSKRAATPAAASKGSKRAAGDAAAEGEPATPADERDAELDFPDGAVKAALPEKLSPQLATLTKTPPTGDLWSVEAKFDGYRLLARVQKGKARLITRNGNDWTDPLRSVAEGVEALGIAEGWLDGEIVVLKDGGGQDFNALQNAIDHAAKEVITYFLFDAPYLDGYDLRALPLDARRAALKAKLEAALERAPSGPVRFSDDFPSSPEEVLKAACAMNLEGVIAKRRDAPYSSSRSETWLKLKCMQRQEFVIGGYSDRANSTTEIGNLFLGVYEDGKLRYAGAMGTGWSLATAAELKRKLGELEVDKSPFETGSVKQTRWSKRVAGAEKWVRPVLVAEVTFAEWTPEGHLRHASFQGLRADKPATSVVREMPVAIPKVIREADEPGEVGESAAAGTATTAKGAKAAAKVADTAAKNVSPQADAKAATTVAAKTATKTTTKTASKTATKTAMKVDAKALAKAVPEAGARVPIGSGPSTPGARGTVSGVKVSSGERVIDASTGITKLELVRFYDSVADRILPHLQGRPVSLVRGPSGVAGELFFQKHMEAKIPGVEVLDPSVWPGHAALIEVNTREALLAAAQMNTIEFHTWNARSKAVDQPDRLIFDLDPGEGLGWVQVQEAATLTRAILEELELVSFLKTSGGKGLHVVVPITPRDGWDAVKGFSQAVVQHLAKTIPDRFVAKAGASNRVGKIFVDWLRNGHGATTAAAFSARARPGLGVSIPVSWDALPSLKSGAQWTVATARDYLSFEKDDPWAAYASTRQTLTAAMKRLGFDPDR